MTRKWGAVLAVALLLLLSACATNNDSPVFFCFDEPYDAYLSVLQALVPHDAVAERMHDGRSILRDGTAVEAFDSEALPLLEAGLAVGWTPQYLATAVIAVDRDRVSSDIRGWYDLADARQMVGMNGDTPYTDHLLAAIAYGLEGEDYSLTSAARLLSRIHSQGNLALGDFDAPLLICFDHQAAAMSLSGRNLEIIVPAEGTLSFQKGMLSSLPIDLPDNRDALLAAGFRLPDGACVEAIYPSEEAYQRAGSLSDYAYLNTTAQLTTRTLRREVLRTRLYTSADEREHLLFALLYIIALVCWTGSIFHRAMQTGVRRAVLTCSVLLVGWVLLRMFKYQLAVEDALNRYAWYCYYLFQLGIPLVALWMALAIDEPGDAIRLPKWWVATAVVNAALTLLVLTNDLHQLAFRMDISGENWNRNYTYGPVYFLVVAAIFLQVLLSLVIMARKSWGSPHKLAFLCSVGMYLLMIAYCVGYVLRVPIAWDSDLTVVTGVFVLLFLELCARVGLMPVNTKYRRFFEHSPQNMQMINDAGEVELLSTAAAPLEREIWQRFVDHPGQPLPNGRDELLFADRVTGGMVVWRENIRSIQSLQREIADSLGQLKAANAILEKEEAVGRSLVATQAQIALSAGMESSIRQHVEALSVMLRSLPSGDDRKESTARVATLVCYIKRRCSLFFAEQSASFTSASELAVYIDELAGLAELAGMQCFCTCVLTGKLPIRHASLMCDGFYALLDFLFTHGGNTLIVQIDGDKQETVFKAIYPDAAEFTLPDTLAAEIASADGVILRDTLMDAYGFRINFPAGGDAGA